MYLSTAVLKKVARFLKKYIHQGREILLDRETNNLNELSFFQEEKPSTMNEFMHSIYIVL